MPDEAMLKRNRDADRLERQASAATLDANRISCLALDRPEKRLSVEKGLVEILSVVVDSRVDVDGDGCERRPLNSSFPLLDPS
jgi:hypothetical protein